MKRRQCASKARLQDARDPDSPPRQPGSKWVRCELPHRHKNVHMVYFPGGGWKWWPRKNAPMPWWFPWA